MMKLGIVSENIRDRSINRILKKGASPEGDCALLCQSGAASYETPLAVERAFWQATNSLASIGGTISYITVQIFLAPRDREIRIKEVTEKLAELSGGYGIPVADCNAEVVANCQSPLVVVNAVGMCNKQKSRQSFKPLDLYMTKWIGMEGSLYILEGQEELLTTRFPESVLRNIRSFRDRMSIVSEAAVAMNAQANVELFSLAQGGVLAGLWKFLDRLQDTYDIPVGMEVNLRNIPVKQETIEICELLGLNPYGLLSGGGMLIAAPKESRIEGKMKEAGISCVQIGTLFQGNDRVLLNGEDRSFLNLPDQDEIYKLGNDSKTVKK